MRCSPESRSKAQRGASFGLHKAFDKAGAVVGPLLAYALLSQFGQSLDGFRKLFATVVVPATAAVAGTRPLRS